MGKVVNAEYTEMHLVKQFRVVLFILVNGLLEKRK